jgi:hypothetical protein
VAIACGLGVLAIAAGAVGGRAWLEEHPLRPGLEGCMDVRQAAARIDCMRDRAGDFAREEGDTRAVAELRRVAGRRTPVECHLAMHRLGERAGRKVGKEGLDERWHELELDARSTCDQGWLHGFMSTVFEGVDDRDLERVLDDCAAVVDRPGECDHAIGHAFVRAERRRDASDALVRCDRLGLTERSGRSAKARLHDCQHGAVMEAALLDAAEDGDEQVDTCEQLDDPRPRRACYEFLAARALLLGDSWEQAARRCERLDDPDREDCRRGWIDAAPDQATCDLHPDATQRRDCRERRA